jgi:hypothetical protein
VDGTPAYDVEDMYSDQAVALICGGPSFLAVDHGMIRRSGILTMTLNNGVRTFRSDLWLGVDSPRKFDRSLWRDRHITKFVPAKRTSHRRVARSVGTYTYERSDTWCTEQVFAPGNTIPWYNVLGSGYRTSMIDAIRVLFILGVRTIYLFGVDFFQSPEYGYHHTAPKFQAGIENNNRIYRNLSDRFILLRPLMEAAGLFIYNCNPTSHLTAFEKRGFPGDIVGTRRQSSP